MVSASQLLADLASFSADLKRKNTNVRRLVEVAEAEAKKLPGSAQISEAAIQTTLCLPFVEGLACGNVKLANNSLNILLRLTFLSTVPLDQVLMVIDILHKWDMPGLGWETQLKILQLLPPITLNYTLSREHFLRLLALCSRLSESPNVAVSNTARATFQQVFSSVCDKLRNHTAGEKSHEVVLPLDLTDEKPQVFHLDVLEAACFSTFLDLACLISGNETENFSSEDIHISAQTLLEIFENVYSLNRDVFESQPELVALLKAKVVPGLLKILNSPNTTFPVVLRVLRVVHLLVESQLPALNDEGEILISVSNHIILNKPQQVSISDSSILDSALSLTGTALAQMSVSTSPAWERILVLEMYTALFGNFPTLRYLYSAYDSNTKRKSVLHEVLSVVNTMLNTNYPQFFAHETVQPAPDRSTGLSLSKQTSELKVSVLDHLDKQEAPSSLPLLYSVHLAFKILLNFVNGVSKFVEKLSMNQSQSDLEVDLDFITAINDSLFPEIFQMLKKFLHCSMDSEHFHALILALQKYIHSIGLLGLSSLRDGLLLMLSDCIIKNTALSESSKKSGAAQLLSIGESIVESISSTIQAPVNSSAGTQLSQKSEISSTRKNNGENSVLHLGSRLFNSRQAVCLGAMYNLAVSLGSTLQASWKIVWITFQWVDYFISGPDKFSGLKDSKNHKEPKLSQQDLNYIEDTRSKFFQSIKDYQLTSFKELYLALTSLYSVDGQAEENISIIPLDVCPFNRTFFIDQLITVLEVDPKKYVLGDDEVWDHFVQYFTKLTTERSVTSVVRNYLVAVFTDFIIGLQVEKPEMEFLAQKSLNALNTFLSALIALGTPKEHLILNCETEMHLTALKTLRQLVDAYDENVKSSWDTVFKILNTTFINAQSDLKQDSNFAEKMALLISTSFDTLKLILDEFLSSLPFSQLKALIDTLLQFCSQTYDLNISFSSVSYFWLISDCIRSSIETDLVPSDENIINSITNLEQLENILSQPVAENPHTMSQALNIYLLARLSNLASDERPRVREGAIQTLFQIIDAYGKQLPSWNLIYDIVLPDLFNMDNLRGTDSPKNRTDAIESLKLVTTGLISMYTKFLMRFDNTVDKTLVEKFWTRLADYFASMLALNWKELNLKLFQSFRDLLKSLTAIDDVPPEITRLMFKFWVKVPVDYDLVKPEYQDSLAVYNESFGLLYLLIQDSLTVDDILQVLDKLNKCGRYPVLKTGQTDNIKPTILQKTVLTNLQLIDKKGHNEEILAAVIQQLSTIVAYPYEIRARIEAKLQNKIERKFKIPSFIALSELALELLTTKLHELKHIQVLLKDRNFIKLVSSLLYAVHDKSPGCPDTGKEPLWVRCNEVIAYLIQRLIEEYGEHVKADHELLQLIVECILVTFEESSETQEAYNIRQYKTLSATVLPLLFSVDAQHDGLVEQFIFHVYRQSFLYELNDIEAALVGKLIEQASMEANEAAFEALALFEFDESFGSTAPLEIFPNDCLRCRCLDDLFSFALADKRSAQIAMVYLNTRSAYCIRRFIADARLLDKKPLPKIQEDEITLVLQGMRRVQHMWTFLQQQLFQKLLSQMLPYALRIEEVDAYVQRILEPMEETLSNSGAVHAG